MVVIFVIGKLVVFDVKVEDWFICGFILIIIKFLFIGLIVNWIFDFLVFIFIFWIILIEVFCSCWYFLFVNVWVGVMVIEFFVCIFIGLRFLIE